MLCTRMYLNYIFVFLLFLSSINTFSQEEAPNNRAKSKQGLVAGLNFTTNTSQHIKITTAYYFGIVNETKLAPSLRFQSGLWYVRNGGKIKGSPYKLRLNYIQIPTLLKVKILGFYALGGLTTSYRVAALRIDGDEEIKANRQEFKRFDFGTQLGLGCKYLFFAVEARYNLGLSNIIREGDEDYRNRYLELGVNVMLP